MVYPTLVQLDESGAQQLAGLVRLYIEHVPDVLRQLENRVVQQFNIHSIPHVNVYDRSSRLGGAVVGVDLDQVKTTWHKRRPAADRLRGARARSHTRIRIQ